MTRAMNFIGIGVCVVAVIALAFMIWTSASCATRGGNAYPWVGCLAIDSDGTLRRR